MKFISWSVNGLKAAIEHGFINDFTKLDADFFCLQRTRLDQGEQPLSFPDYYQYWNYAEKKGYAGTAIFTKIQPATVKMGIDNPQFDTEGRTITLEYSHFYLVNTYVPVAGEKLEHLTKRLAWDQAFRAYIAKLMAKKPVIIAGDMSVAAQAIDLAEPTKNHHHAGFTKEERADFQQLLDLGLTDTFRYEHPDQTGAYTWWSFRSNARFRNIGWRLDYFLVSDQLVKQIKEAKILSEITGSSHCPIELILDQQS